MSNIIGEGVIAMNRRQTRQLASALALVWVSLAGPAAAAAPISLKDTAQKAILTNPEVLQKWHAYLAAVNERGVAFGGYLPRLDLSAQTGRVNQDDPLFKKDYNQHSATLLLTQMLYDGFATRDEVRRLDHALSVRLFEVIGASEAAALEVTRAWLDVQRYRKLVALAEENYVRHRATQQQMEHKVQAGVGRRVDLELVAGRLALAESNLLTETANLHDVSARYQRLVGETPPLDMAPAGSLAAAGDAAQVLKAVLDRSPAIRAAVENVRAAQAAVSARRSAFQPRVDLRLRQERGTDLGGYAGQTDNRTAEVVLNWNLFNGMSDRARVRQYVDQLDMARDLRDKACRDERQTAAIAVDDVRKLTEGLVFLDQHQLSMEKARDAYRKQFDIGQRSLLDLLDTENELFQARRAYTNAEYDLAIAQARARASAGDLMAALGITRVGVDQAADPQGWEAGEEAAAFCPPEAPRLYVADKAALDARAAQMVRDSVVPAAAAGAAAPMAAGEAEVRAALKGWAAAWSGRDVAAYLDSYAETFKPAGSDRTAWAEGRRRVIGKAGEINLELADIKVSMAAANRASTSFRQSYRASSYQDVVAKTLEWQKSGGRWRIVAESSRPQ
jgi:adhesin transport system outer membrane protein